MGALKPNPNMNYAQMVESIKAGLEKTLRSIGGNPKLKFVAVKFYFVDETDDVMYTYTEKARDFDFRKYEDGDE